MPAVTRANTANTASTAATVASTAATVASTAVTVASTAATVASTANTPTTDLSCALLIHSTDRPAARAFWEESLVTADRHWPHDVCNGAWYFSYERDALGQLPPILARLRHRPRLIRRAVDAEWVAAMRAALAAIAERHVFHVMDDSAIPAPLPARAVRSVVALAASLNDDRRSASFGGSVSGESPARGGGSMIS